MCALLKGNRLQEASIQRPLLISQQLGPRVPTGIPYEAGGQMSRDFKAHADLGSNPSPWLCGLVSFLVKEIISSSEDCSIC